MEEGQQSYLVNEKNWSPWVDNKCLEAPFTSETPSHMMSEGSSIMIGEDKCPSDQEEKFGDSLHQLNKIVERISPDSSGVGYPNFNQHHKLNNLTNRTRPSFASSFTESMGDSAYETFAGDNSYDCSNEGQFVEHHHRGIGEPYIDPRNHSQWQHSLNEWQQDPRSNMIKVPSVNNLYQKSGDVYSSHLVDQGHQIMGNGINYNSYDSNKISKPECLTREFSFSEDHHKSLYNYSTDKNLGRKQGRSNDNQYSDLSGREFRYGSGNEFEHEKSISNWQLPGSKNFLEIGKYSTEDRSNSSKSYEHFPAKSHHGNLKSNQCSTERQVSSDCNLTSDSRNSSDEDDVKGDGDGNGRQTFSCSHCNFGASKKGQLRKHMSMHGVFLCAHCEFASEIAEVLEDHRRMSHPGLCGRKLCKKCRVLYQGDELEEHEKLCSGEKQHWTCPVCHKEFKFLSVMKAHARKWHPNETGILMSNNMMLGSASHQESSWRTSAADSTTGEMTPDNDSSRAPSSGEDFHASGHFDGRRTCFIGSENKKIGLKKGIEQGFYKANHEKLGNVSMHTEDLASRGPSYNDDVCSAGETPPLEVPFFCDFESCCTTFRSDKELNVHRMSIHGLPPKRYHCRHPDCSMQFAKYGHYKRHQLSHAGGGEKKFKCDWPNCGKAFCHTDNLKVHYRRHTDEKPYKCDKCASSYRQKSGLKYHLEKAHDEKSTGRPGRKRKNLNAVEEPAHYSTSHKWESQEFQNFPSKEYNKNQDPLKLPETSQLRYEQNYSAPSGNTGPGSKSMTGGFHSFYEQTDLQNLMKVKSYNTNQKNEMIKMDHHLGGWGGPVKPVHIDRVYQEPGNMVPNMRSINPLNGNCSVDGKGNFNSLERSQSNRHNFYLSKSSSYCNPQNPSNLSVNYIEEMNEGENALTALPLMNKSNLESELASSSEDEWTNYSQHIKPVGSRSSMHEEPIDEAMMEREHAGRREIGMVDVINKTSDLSDSKTTLTYEKDLAMSDAMVNSKNTFEKLPGETDPDVNKPEGNTVLHSENKSNQNLHDDSSDNKLAEKSEEQVDACDDHEDQTCVVRKSPDKSLSRNSPKCLRASSVERSEVSNATFEALEENEEKSISSVDHGGSKKAPDYYGSPESNTDKVDKSIEGNPPNSPWRERSSQNNDLCWPEAPQPHAEMGSFSSSKGWPRVLDASLTESHSSEANNAHKSIFESSENTSADDNFSRNADSCDKVRNSDRPPDISSFGAPNYQMLNDYPSSRHPLFNDNYCFSPSAAANLSYGNVYNFSTNMRRAGGCLDAFSGPPFQAAERYGRGDDHDYRDPGLRIGSGYNSFLHSSPYPYDPRHYHAPENPLMPGSYDFAYSASTLPPFPPPPPPPSFSLTRPWTGHSDFDIISGSETLKSSSSHRLYQSPYGQSNSLNRYF